MTSNIYKKLTNAQGKFVKKDDKILLQEKIYWNEYIKVDEEKSEVKEIASSIKNLAERLMIS